MENTIEIRNKLRSEIRNLKWDRSNTGDRSSKEYKELSKGISTLKKKLKKLLPQLVPGKLYFPEDFNDLTEYRGKSDAPENLFFRENKYLSDSEKNIIKELVGDNQGIYNHFNKNYSPFDVKEEELHVHKKEVKSSNIYDIMAAQRTSTIQYSLRVKINHNFEPITLLKICKKDTTLSMRHINSFM